MPWTLTTPIDVGDLDSQNYGEVKIVRQAHDSVRRMIAVDLEYGNTIGGKWAAGLPLRSKPSSVTIAGDEYTSLVEGAQPQQGEATYDAVKRGLYAFLASKGVIGPGSLT
jgi:hypothetical protein